MSAGSKTTVLPIPRPLRCVLCVFKIYLCMLLHLICTDSCAHHNQRPSEVRAFAFALFASA
jgi:hypothetical protein